MTKYIPTKAEVKLTRDTALKLVRENGFKGRLTIEPGLRISTNEGEDFDPQMNIRLVDKTPHWEESDLFSHGEFNDFKKGFPLDSDDNADVDLYLYCNEELALNMTVEIRKGELVRLACTNYGPPEGKTLWSAPTHAEKPSKVESIDMTPTWEETSRMLALILERGTPEGRATAMLELERMARLADFANVVLGAHRRPDAPCIPEAEEIRRKVAAYDATKESGK